MKLSFKYIFLGLLLIIICVLFTPIGPKLRAYVGRIVSYSSVKLKAEKTIPESTYSWEVKDLDGKAYLFQNTKGKIVFINLWATWCKPCLEELPSIQALYEDYQDKVDFLLVSKEESKRVNTFVSKKSYQLPFYLAEGQIPQIFKSATLPTTYIINKQGKVVRAENGAVNWNSEEIRQFLDQLLME